MLKILTDFFTSAPYSIPVSIEVDMHSHLLPGIDDGAKSLQDSIDLIAALKAMGFRKLITTPHIMSHRYPNNAEIIQKALSQVKRELRRQHIDIEIEAAAEYYLDDHLYELILKGEILTFGDNYLLFEMSYAMAPVDLDIIIFEMQCAGYQPVLAHPERFRHMHNHFEKYEALKERGVLFQLDTNSLNGYYSKSVQKMAMKLVDEGMIDLIGTDTHHQRHISSLEETLRSKNYQKLFEKNVILNNAIG